MNTTKEVLEDGESHHNLQAVQLNIKSIRLKNQKDATILVNLSHNNS